MDTDNSVKTKCKNETVYRTFALCLLILGALDAVTTNFALSIGYIEANPLIAALIGWLGIYWLLPKMLFHFLLSCILLVKQTKKALINAGVVCTVYLAVVVNNFLIITGG